MPTGLSVQPAFQFFEYYLTNIENVFFQIALGGRLLTLSVEEAAG
jgi:hypothetical protein